MVLAVIDKREILDEADVLGLNPHVVEKDYVLGWLLWAVLPCSTTASSTSPLRPVVRLILWP